MSEAKHISGKNFRGMTRVTPLAVLPRLPRLLFLLFFSGISRAAHALTSLTLSMYDDLSFLKVFPPPPPLSLPRRLKLLALLNV